MLPALICATNAAGSAAASTFKPSARAVFGLTPSPTPPNFSPAIASCSRSLPPQKSSEPNVSKRKIRLPSSSIRLAFACICSSKLPCAAGLGAAGCAAPLSTFRVPHPTSATTVVSATSIMVRTPISGGRTVRLAASFPAEITVASSFSNHDYQVTHSRSPAPGSVEGCSNRTAWAATQCAPVSRGMRPPGARAAPVRRRERLSQALEILHEIPFLRCREAER